MALVVHTDAHTHTLTQAQRNCCLILSGQRGSTGISQWVTTSLHTCACTDVVVYSNVNDSDRKVQDKWKRSDQICANTHERMQITMRVNQLHINNARNIPECTLQQKSIKLMWCFHTMWHRSNNVHCYPLWCNTACMLIYSWRTLFFAHQWHLRCAQSHKQ